ncbi:CHAT domain-containing protein [Oculatella sp. LEGE 06141]|uniref:nSTAND1 domain-containing NTPase n=1 Tax=Oculatella sp. LEGE 06141 TaxID=1828648 RepID=UPI001882F38A|nr:CHAT domain-containing protein [Oculatella sp. LEGE 06141]MBE9179092.1 CHAT domain-containing protein [Oculatella sp. LEGE 06141]
MGKLVILDLDGNLEQGVSVTLEIRADADFSQAHTGLQSRAKGKLPAATDLLEQYHQWRSLYRQLSLLFRLGRRPNAVTNGSTTSLVAACRESAHRLVEQLNAWLAAPSFRPIREPLLEKLSPHDTVRLILQTEDNALRHLPWHLWDVLQRYPQAEVALSAPAYEQIELPLRPRTHARILAVLGDRTGIDIEADRQLLTALPDGAETVFLVEPSRQELQQWLWDAHGWDILFFAGHSSSAATGAVGQLEINPTDRLSLDELTYGLKKAIARGLKLAIFNSCDGLGLAHELERLHIPQMIVMREPVPDRVAQAFLNHFLTSFSGGQPLYSAVRDAREQLQSLEDQCPCATWLPIICQNPTEIPLYWHALTSSFVAPGQLPITEPDDPLSADESLPPCPYLGLSAFQESDAPVFFGRETVAETLVDAVHQRPLVAVIGSSGSGKSSLVFAGLVPRLRQLGGWLILSFRPGDRPFIRLAEQLIPLLEPDLSETDQLVEINKLAIAFQQQQLTLTDVMGRIVQKQDVKHVLLVADQFEELYSLCKEADRQPFLAELLATIDRAVPLTLVFTLRADFCESALAYRPLAEALRHFPPTLLGPMTRAELQAAIEQPAAALGIGLADGLTERILDAVDAAPGHLPLLEFALTLLWEQQRQGSLTHAAYEAIGGVERALAGYADQIYQALDPMAQQQARQIFMQLVRPGDGTADTRRLATRSEIGEPNWPLVNDLANMRLVVSQRDEATGEDVVEIAHEALIQEWHPLRQWLAEDRSFRMWQERLRGTVRQWETSQRDDGALLRGAPLLEADHWQQQRQADLSPIEQQFIQTSLSLQSWEQSTRDRQRRRRQFGLVSGLTMAFFLTGIAGWQWHRAEVGQTNAQLDALTASSVELFDSGQEIEALMTALKAGKQLGWFVDSAPDTRMKAIASLQQIVYGMREYNRLDGHDRTVISVSFSPDGQQLASAGDDHTVRLWQRNGQPIATLSGHTDRVRSVSYSPDGQWLASASYDGTVRLWQADGTAIATLQGHTDKVNSVSFSSDGQWLASAGADGMVLLWRRDRTQPGFELHPALRMAGHQGWISAVQFSPNGQQIASAGTDGTVRLWRLDGTVITTLKASNASINNLAFSPDGLRLAAGNKAGTLLVWQQHQGSFQSLAQSIPAHGDRVWGVTFSPDGETLASASADNTVKLWQLNGTLVNTLEGHSSSVYSVSYSSDGSILASASADQSIRLWHPSSPRSDVVQMQDAPVTDVSFNTSGQLLATASAEGRIQLRRLDGNEPTTIDSNSQRINRLRFSPDGQTIAAASADATIRLWTLEGDLRQTLFEQANLFDLSFSPDGQAIAAASEDGTVKLWQRDSNNAFPNRPTQVLRGHDGWVAAVAFSPNGQWLASASDDDTVKLWKRSSYGGFESTPSASLIGHTSRVNYVSFSVDGQTIATASGDGYVKLWRPDGTLIATLSGHSERVNSVIFSPNGRILASATADGTVRLWSLNGSLLKTLQGHTSSISNISFSPDGQILASAGLDQTVILWNLDLDDLVMRGCSWIQDYLQTNSTLTESDRQVCRSNDYSRY